MSEINKFCAKCGSDDLLTSYIKADETICERSASIDNEYIRSTPSGYFYLLKAKKEHLSRRCRNCQHEWLEDTLDSNLD